MLPKSRKKKWRADLRAQCALADAGGGGGRVIGCHSSRLAPTGVCSAECYTPLSAPAHKELTLGISGSVGGGSVRGVFVQVGVEGIGMVGSCDLGFFLGVVRIGSSFVQYCRWEYFF